MMKDQSVRDSVREILESAQESDRQLPSIRAIRAKIGKGSLGTISEAVNEWKQEKLVQQGELPSGFEQREAENIIKAVWEAVAPMIRAQIEQIDSRAKTRIQIEHDEESRVREAADEAVAVLLSLLKVGQFLCRFEGQFLCRLTEAKDGSAACTPREHDAALLKWHAHKNCIFIRRNF